MLTSNSCERREEMRKIKNHALTLFRISEQNAH